MIFVVAGFTRMAGGIGWAGGMRAMAATARLDTLQSVELAEGVEIGLRVAGPLPRMVAYVIDFFIRGTVLSTLGFLLAIGGVVVGEQVSIGLGVLAWFAVSWWYPVLFEASRWGATPGKKALGLRVVQPTGVPATFGQAVVRNFLRFVDEMPFFTYGVGLAACVSGQRFQRLGDMAAGTVVVYERGAVEPAGAAPPPMAPARPPVALTRAEARALVSFRERARNWSEARRRELADHLSFLTGETGSKGVAKLMSMAHWLQEGK